MADIVITGLQSWHMAMGGNIVNMAKEFARNHRVLFVNYALDRMTLWKQPNNPLVKKYKINKKNPENTLEQIEENLWVFTPLVVLESVSQVKNKSLFDFLNNLNINRFSNSILPVIRQLAFKNFILFTDSDFYRSIRLKEILHPALFVYYIRDHMIATHFFRHHGARMEEAMIRKADLVVTNSEFLADYGRQFNPHSYYVGQGCDAQLFNPDNISEFPEDIMKIRKMGKPIIGYVGALRSIRIDLALLEEMAIKSAQWNFVFVGWEDEAFQKSKLHKQDNVFFLGAKKEDELPAYIKGFDVAMNPQVYNDLTRGNYPRKIDEYLAMGKPVIATNTEAMEMFRDICYLGRTADDYTMLIEKALKENSPHKEQERILLGREHSWEKNIREVFHAINEVVPSFDTNTQTIA
jgi:teichuronic acid biosynthesis glycosyltransferase TuaH